MERVKRKIFLILTSVLAIVAFCFAAFSLSPSPVRAEGEQKVVTITGFCQKVSTTKIRFYAEGTAYGETYIGKVTATDGNRYDVKLTDVGSEDTKRKLDFDFSVGTLSSPDFFIFPDVFVNPDDPSKTILLSGNYRVRYAAAKMFEAPSSYTAGSLTAAGKAANDGGTVFGNSLTRYFGVLETGMTGTNNNGEVFYGSVYDLGNAKYVPVKAQEIGSESGKRLVRFYFGDRNTESFLIKADSKFMYAKENDGTFKAFNVDKDYKVSWNGNNAAPTVAEAFTLTVTNGEGSGIFGSGENATVTATVPAGYEFVGWKDESGVTVSDANPYTFAVTANTSLTAVLKEKAIETKKIEIVGLRKKVSDTEVGVYAQGVSGDIPAGVFSGKVYGTDGAEYAMSFKRTGSEASGVLISLIVEQGASIKDTTYFILFSEEFVNADGTEKLAFGKNYKVFYQYGENTKVTEESPGYGENPEALYGAYIRLGVVNGLRFKTQIRKENYAYLTDVSGYTARCGYIIMPYDYIETYGEITAENLFENGTYYSANGIFTSANANYTENSVRVIDLECSLNESAENPDYYQIYGTISNVLTENLERKFVGTGYIRLTKGDEVRYILAGYNGGNILNNSRSMMEVAEAAYNAEGTSDETKQEIYDRYLVHKTGNNGNIVENGVANYSILISASATKNETFAANELKNILKKATGADVAVLNDGDISYDSSRSLISIGNTAFLAESGINTAGLGESGYVITTNGGKVLYIAGETDYGTLYGVYGWLKEVVNYRYYGVSAEDLSACSTNVENITLADCTGVTFKPTFDFRMVTYREARFDDANGKYKTEETNRLKERAGDFYFVNGMDFHNSFNILPSSAYAAAHQSWYYHDGTTYRQLCYSNAEMRTNYIDKLKYYINNHNAEAKVLVLGIEDNAYWCDCTECKKVSASDLMVDFANEVETAINAWRTNNGKNKITVLVFGYYNTLAAPSSSVSMNENVGVMFAPIKASFRNSLRGTSYETALRGWAAKTSNIYVWSYNFYTQQTFVLYDTFGAMKDNYALFAECGVKGIYDQTESFMPVSTAFGRLKQYVQAELMWDCSQDTETLINDWFTVYFGNAAPTMKAIFNETRTSYNKIYDYENLTVATVSEQANTEYNSEIGQDFSRFRCLSKGILSTGKYYNDFKGNLESWIGALNNLMTTHSSDAELAERIKLESIQYRYLYIKIYGESSAITKAAFKADVTELGITHYAEGKPVDGLWTAWNI